MICGRSDGQAYSQIKRFCGGNRASGLRSGRRILMGWAYFAHVPSVGANSDTLKSILSNSTNAFHVKSVTGSH